MLFPFISNGSSSSRSSSSSAGRGGGGGAVVAITVAVALAVAVAVAVVVVVVGVVDRISCCCGDGEDGFALRVWSLWIFVCFRGFREFRVNSLP